MTTCFTLIDSPVGTLLLTSNGDSLTRLYMQDKKHGDQEQSHWRRDDAMFKSAHEQLAAYFAGELTAFDLPLETAGTDFQRKVWRALRKIPYGKTESYGELAKRLGKPSAARAVGMANGRNPISIIVPCHRVIGADGSLTGYGGGIERKHWLLEHERRYIAQNKA